jgi:hypothetical protein
MMLVWEWSCQSRLPAFASRLGDVRTISAYLKLDISTNKWQQRVFWHGEVLSGLRTTQAEVTAMDGESFRDPRQRWMMA